MFVLLLEERIMNWKRTAIPACLCLLLAGCGPSASMEEYPGLTLIHRAEENLYAIGAEYALDGGLVGGQLVSTDRNLRLRLPQDAYDFVLELPQEQDWQGGTLTVTVYVTTGEERQSHAAGELTLPAEAGNQGRWTITGSGDSFALTAESD